MSDYTGKSVVADLYQLTRLNGKFVETNKVKIREGCKITFSYMEEMNANSVESGKLYILDEKATEERFDKQADNAEKRKANEALNKVSTADLIKAIKGDQKPQEEDEKLSALRDEYKELANEDAKLNWKAETLEKKIEALKNTTNQ